MTKSNYIKTRYSLLIIYDLFFIIIQIEIFAKKFRIIVKRNRDRKAQKHLGRYFVIESENILCNVKVCETVVNRD